jgi:tetratricopeptide (TPR) repeat protein
VLQRSIAVLQVLFFAALTFTWAFPAFAQFPGQSYAAHPSDSESGLEALPPEERGDLLMNRHAYVAAASAYNEAPKSAAVWNKMGIAWHHMRAIRVARKDYQKALALDPNYPDAMNNLAATYFGDGDFKKAIGLYERALQLSPNSAVVLANLGTADFALGRTKQGADAYRAAFAADPDVFDTATHPTVDGGTQARERARLDYCLAELYAGKRDVERAVDYLNKAFSEGFADRKRVQQDEAFAGLRENPEFAQFLAVAGTR